MINTGYQFPKAVVNLYEIPATRGAKVPTFSQLLIGPVTKKASISMDFTTYGKAVVRNLSIAKHHFPEPNANLVGFESSLGSFLRGDSFAASFVKHLGMKAVAIDNAYFLVKNIGSNYSVFQKASYLKNWGTIEGLYFDVDWVTPATYPADNLPVSLIAKPNTDLNYLVYYNGTIYYWPFATNYIPNFFGASDSVGLIRFDLFRDTTAQHGVSVQVVSVGESGGKIRLTLNTSLANLPLPFLLEDTTTGKVFFVESMSSDRKTVVGYPMTVGQDGTIELAGATFDTIEPFEDPPFEGNVEDEVLLVSQDSPGIYDAESFIDDDPTNILGFAAYVADRGAGYTWVYPLTNSTEDLSDLEDKILQMVEKPYFIHPLTSNANVQQDVFNIVSNHPDEFLIMTQSIEINDSNQITIDSFWSEGTVQDNTKYYLELPPDRIGDFYQIGDKVSLGSVTALVNNKVFDTNKNIWKLELSSQLVGPGMAVIYRPVSSEQLAQYVAEKAGSWESRNVWPFAQRVVYKDRMSRTHVLPPFYLAILHTSIYSHIPVRRPKRGLETTFFYRLYDQLDRFKIDDLRILASGGITVYIQPNEGGPAWALDGLTSDMRDVKTQSQAITLQVFLFARTLKNRVSHMPLERWMMSEADSAIRAAFNEVYAATTAGHEPIVGRATSITEISDDPEHPENGKIVKIMIQTQYGFDYVTFNLFY